MNTEFDQKVAFVQKDCLCVKEFYKNHLKTGQNGSTYADFASLRAKN